MKKRNIFIAVRCFFLIIICLLSGATVFGQSTSFLGDGIHDFIRRNQLLGQVSIQSSLTSQSFSAHLKAIDSLADWKTNLRITKGASINSVLLPVGMSLQYNTHHPDTRNDAGMIPAKGMQTAFSAGFQLSAGRFSLQVKPEFVFAGNPGFDTFYTDLGDEYWVQRYRWLNSSDIPERFGDKPFTKIYAGQSSLRINTGPVSIGLSTESLWWGPGMRNALVMSNNAPGFLHGTINTTRPIQTRIGNFEGQIIGGSLLSSGILPPQRNRYNTSNERIYIPKREETRYLSGIVLSWQPKWVKGLFVGFARASYLYSSDISFADILPLAGIIKSTSEKNNRKAMLGSLFARYVMPAERAELYIEYGRNDKLPDLANLVADNGYPRAFVAGFRKLFATRNNTYIEVMSEFTQIQLPNEALTRSARSWYTDTAVRHGYTNQGQVMGSWLGPGSNSQMIDISWVKGYNKIGLMFERVLQNNDFYYNAFSQPVAPNDFSRHWVDVSTTAHVDWHFQKLFLSSQVRLVRSINYQWYIFQGLPYFTNGWDVLNFHAKVSVAYRL